MNTYWHIKVKARSSLLPTHEHNIQVFNYPLESNSLIFQDTVSVINQKETEKKNFEAFK